MAHRFPFAGDLFSYSGDGDGCHRVWAITSGIFDELIFTMSKKFFPHFPCGLRWKARQMKEGKKRIHRCVCVSIESFMWHIVEEGREKQTKFDIICGKFVATDYRIWKLSTILYDRKGFTMGFIFNFKTSSSWPFLTESILNTNDQKNICTFFLNGKT